MSQKVLAKKTGYSKAMISLILSGVKRPGALGALRLERVTGIPFRVWITGKPRQIRKEFDKWASCDK